MGSIPGKPGTKWIFLDLAIVDSIQLLVSLGEIVFKTGKNGKCQVVIGVMLIRIVRIHNE